jgi:hypothetical protein
MKNNITISLLLLSSIIIKAQDTIYFDKNWEVTTKDNHSFYRPLPLKKLGNLFLLRDFYKNGTLQMQGYLLDENNENSYVGDIFWYDKNGLDESEVQYYNKTTTKELIYYFNDNTIWKKVNYNKDGEKNKIEVFYKNKPLYTGTIDNNKDYKGIFTKSLRDNYYIDSTPEPETVVNPPVSIVVPPPMTYGQNVEEPKLAEAYKTIIYWQNGKKAEETVYGIDEYNVHKKLRKIVWDKNEKLLLSLDLSKSDFPSNYTELSYYTTNDFARNINNEKIYRNSQLVESKFYTIDGQLKAVEKYADGELIEKNNLLTKRKSFYKNGQPWDGEFEKNIGQNLLTFELKNGIKINQEVVKSIDNDKIIYKGDYKNGTPWNGLFLVERDYDIELLRYENGVLNGIQKVFMNYYDDLIEEYEMKNGVHEGFRKQYKDGKLINESVYKNNRIVNGVVSDKDVKNVYTDGKIVEKIYSSDYSDEIKRKEKYIDGKLASIDYYNFSIKDNEQEFYQGKFKNQQPYEGYFLNDSLISDFPLVNFYKNGQLTTQYSYDFLDKMDNYQHYMFDIKSSFINGKISDGSLFKMIGNTAIIKEDYKNKQLIKFDLNLFAMHYFNRISFVSKNNEIIVSELQSPFTIRIKAGKKDNLEAGLYDKDKLIYSNSNTNTIKEGSPNSVTIYYLENDKLKKYHFIPPQFEDDVKPESDFMFKILGAIPTKIENKKNTLNTILQGIENYVMRKTGYDSEENYFNFPFKEKDIVTYSDYNDKGEKQSGLFIQEKSDKSFLIEMYKNGKKVSSEHVQSIEELLEYSRK